MKINRVHDKDKPQKSSFDFWSELYYCFVFYRYLAFTVIGTAVSVGLFLLILDWLIPSQLERLDGKATIGLFKQLQQDGRHSEAITLMEYKGGIFEDSPNQYIYKSMLADSYIHVGDYGKAEKLYLDLWTNMDSFLTSRRGLSDKLDDTQIRFFKMNFARMIYTFYERIGDTRNQKRFFQAYRDIYLEDSATMDSLMMEGARMAGKESVLSADKFRRILEYDRMVVDALDDKSQAMSDMGGFIDDIYGQADYSPAYKIKCLNKLISWQMDEGKVMDAYPRIAQAVDQARLLKAYDDMEVLGELSDFCYRIHDVPLSRKLYLKYRKYVEDKYSKTDFEYLSCYERSFRYLESNGEWEALVKDLVGYSKGMRDHIARCMPSMSEDQREYFARQFEMAYEYSFDVLQKHPTQELANLCFENLAFKSGLLLRSSLSERRNIERMASPELMQMYDELDSCRRELVYLSVSGKRIFTSRESLEQHIDELEKAIALRCTDFRTREDAERERLAAVRGQLQDGQAVVAMIEHRDKLLALIMDSKGVVSYIPIGSFGEIAAKLQRPIFEVYHDTSLTDYLWHPVAQKLGGVRQVFYYPVGMFNQIALGTLFAGNGLYLCDMLDLQLVSNLTVMASLDKFTLAQGANPVSLWGGIDYGGGVVQADTVKRKAITRGENLCDLKYAYQEVEEIAAMLEGCEVRSLVFTRNEATEVAFKHRSGKGDPIIHVSTHGFFNDKADFYHSMLESGLFFAGANRYWANDSTILETGQEDGILRAAEISTMDLNGCELVVLSACETGLGFSQSSEGVYGLQRAFKLSGAGQILMSLWEVDDRATTLLMTEFYKGLLAGKTSDQALADSRRIVRQAYPSPEDWGAFVLLH